MFSYTFPLLDLLWALLMFAGIFLLLFFVIWCFVDNFRRRDHHGAAKAGWTLLILLVPFVGALIYIIARPQAAQRAAGGARVLRGGTGRGGRPAPAPDIRVSLAAAARYRSAV